MKAVHKGIVIIILPLAVQVGAILTLMCVLNSAQEQIEESARSRDVLAAVDTFRRRLARDNVLSLLGRIDPSKKDDEKKRILAEQLESSIDEIDKLTKEHRAEQKLVEGLRKRLRLSRYVQNLIENYPHGVSIATTMPKVGAGAQWLDGLRTPVLEFMKLEGRPARAMPQLIHSVRGQLLATLLLDVLFTFFSVILVLSMGRDLAKRNQSMLNNAWRLMANQPLLVPMPGNDEIAELDSTLHKSGKELLVNEEFRQGIIATVSHELRSPLSSLSATLSVLSAGVLGQLRESAERTLASAAETAIRVISIINNLLDLEMIESGKMQSAKERVNMAQQASSAFYAVQEIATQKSVSIVLEIAKDLEIQGDNAQVQRLLEELLHAAIEDSKGHVIRLFDASNQGRVSISIEYQSDANLMSYEIDQPALIQTNAIDEHVSDSLRWSVCRELAHVNGLNLLVKKNLDVKTIELRPGRTEGAGVSIRQELPSGELLSQPRGWSSMKRKWLIFALPVLLSQFLFGVAIVFFCNQVQKELEVEYKAWNLTSSASLITTAMIREISSITCYKMTADPYILSNKNQYKKEVLEAADTFKRTLGDDIESNRSLIDKLDSSINTLSELVDRSFATSIDTDLDTAISKEDGQTLESAFEGVLLPIENLIESQQKVQEQNRQSSYETRRKINMLVAVALGFSVVSGILLMLALYLTIIKRLSHLMTTSKALSERTQLGPMLSGSDESASLDRILHFIDERFRRFESFKRRSAQVIGKELLASLCTIRSGMQSLVDNEDLTDKALKRVENVIDDCSRLMRMVEDLVSARTMDSGRFELKIESSSTDQIVDAAVLSVEQLAQKSKISIEKPGENFELECDRDRVIQVLINFLSNAIKFSPPESSIQVHVDDVDGFIEFSVSDEGRGIPEEKIGLLFQRFEQSETSDWKEKGGSGLGLYICKTIAEQHGGEIGLDSVECTGSTFWVRLPGKQLDSLI